MRLGLVWTGLQLVDRCGYCVCSCASAGGGAARQDSRVELYRLWVCDATQRTVVCVHRAQVWCLSSSRTQRAAGAADLSDSVLSKFTCILLRIYKSLNSFRPHLVTLYLVFVCESNALFEYSEPIVTFEYTDAQCTVYSTYKNVQYTHMA